MCFSSSRKQFSLSQAQASNFVSLARKTHFSPRDITDISHMSFHFLTSENLASNQNAVETGAANLLATHNLVPEVNRLLYRKWGKREQSFVTTFVQHLPDLKKKYFRAKKQTDGQNTVYSIRYTGLKALALRALATREQSNLQALLLDFAQSIAQQPGFQLGSAPLPPRQHKHPTKDK
jgi:hypothetical protein